MNSIFINFGSTSSAGPGNYVTVRRAACRSVAKTLSIQFRMAVDLAIVKLHLFHVYEHKDRINITGIVLKAKQ